MTSSLPTNRWEAWSARRFPRLHCLTDQTLRWQRRLRVRFFVNFSFSASMNVRTRGVQARLNIATPPRDASRKSGNLGPAPPGRETVDSRGRWPLGTAAYFAGAVRALVLRFSLRSSLLGLHFSHDLPSACAATQHLCRHSLPSAAARSQQVGFFWGRSAAGAEPASQEQAHNTAIKVLINFICSVFSIYIRTPGCWSTRRPFARPTLPSGRAVSRWISCCAAPLVPERRPASGPLL